MMSPPPGYLLPTGSATTGHDSGVPAIPGGHDSRSYDSSDLRV